VVAPDNAVANALATTLNVISVEDGFALVKATPGAEALIVLKDGAQLRSKGFERLERGGDVAAAGWADGSRVEMTLEVLESRDRPYVAVWVEDQQGEHVVTLAEWGNNGRYITSLFIWMREAGLEGDQIMRSGVSRATRPAGVYKLSWDGKDQKGQVVPAGKYRICVEFNTEHNGHSSGAVNLLCAGKEGSGVVKGSQHFSDMTVSYVVKK